MFWDVVSILEKTTALQKQSFIGIQIYHDWFQQFSYPFSNYLLVSWRSENLSIQNIKIKGHHPFVTCAKFSNKLKFLTT